MNGNQITISTLTVSSINNGTPGVAAYSTFNASSINVTSTTTTSTLITGTIATTTGFTTIGQNTSFPNRSIEIGADAANSVYLDFHSSDSAYPDYSTRIQSNGGSTIGQGHMMIQASTINIVGTSGVGIGTSTPLTTLNIYNTTADSTRGPDGDNRAGQLTISNSKTGTSVYSMAIGMDQVFGIGYINAAGNNTMQPVCLNTRGGNVGIGITNPTGKCHIYGSGQSTGTGDVYSLNVSSADSFNGNGAITVFSESINLKAGDLTWNPAVRVHGARIYIGGGYSINGAFNQGYIGMFTGNAERVRFTDAGISFSGTNHIHFGYDVAGKEANAGKMGYQVFTSGALDIVGAGTGGRTVKIWDSLTVQTSIGIGTNSPNISLDAWGTNNGIGRNRNFGSQHDADKRDSFYIGRWDSTNANYFLGMRCMVDTPANIGYGEYNNQTRLSFITWGSNYTDPAEAMRIRGDGIIMFNRGGYTSNGTLVTTGGTGTLLVSSDRRIKEDIVYVEDTVAALDQINHLKPATYRFIGQEDVYLGFIAQDVEQYIPLAVDGKKHEYQWETDDNSLPKVDANGELVYRVNDQGEKLIRPRGLTDRAIIAVQTLAIQELSKTATSSATQIQELSKKVDSLIARLAAAGIA